MTLDAMTSYHAPLMKRATRVTAHLGTLQEPETLRNAALWIDDVYRGLVLLQERDPTRAASAASQLWRLFHRLGLGDRLHEQLRSALNLARTNMDSKQRALADAALGALTLRQGDPVGAIAHLKKAATALRDSGLDATQAEIHLDLAAAHRKVDELPLAWQNATEAQRIVATVQNRWLDAKTAAEHARLFTEEGQFSLALKRFQEAATRFQEIGDTVGEADAAIEFALLAVEMKRPSVVVKKVVDLKERLTQQGGAYIIRAVDRPLTKLKHTLMTNGYEDLGEHLEPVLRWHDGA